MTQWSIEIFPLKYCHCKGPHPYSCIMLPHITLNRHYGWVGGFLRQLLNVISWQFDCLHPNRPKFTYLMFAMQLSPVLYYFQLIEVKTKVKELKQHLKRHGHTCTEAILTYPSICVHESRHFSAILIFYNKDPKLIGKYNSQ